MLGIRYEYLHRIASALKPKSIIEIGVAKGENALKLLKSNRIDRYDGYDVFDFSDKAFHKAAGNGKSVSSKEDIYRLLSPHCPSVNLHKGFTSDTLWGQNILADLVWLDGDHRVEAIGRDFAAVRNSKVVVFDDYYSTGEHAGYTTEQYGCNKIVDQLGVLITPKTRRFPNIRLAVYTEDPLALAAIEKVIR